MAHEHHGADRVQRASLSQATATSSAGTLRYGDIVAVIDAAKGAGVTRVGVITEGMRRGGRRRLSTVRGVWVLALALTAAACDGPAPPAVSVRQPSLTPTIWR